MEIIAIVGQSESGKTTLIENLIEDLSARGIRIGALKHHTHGGLEFDRKGKDSYRLNNAGAEISILSSPKEIAMVRSVKEEWSPLKIAEKLMEDMDLILCEGFNESSLPRIILVSEKEDLEIFSIGPVLGLVPIKKEALKEIEHDHPTFSRDNIKEIANFLEKEFELD